MDKEIKLVNRIILEAIVHGADAGGSYAQNEEGLKRSITRWLKYKGFDDKYTIKEKDVEKWQGDWPALQIVPKGKSGGAE